MKSYFYFFDKEIADSISKDGQRSMEVLQVLQKLDITVKVEE